MGKDELLDLVDENDNVIGEVWKSEAHSDPSKIHREVAVVIFDNTGKTLIQQRSLKKKFAPGKWILSAAGHVGKGENSKTAALRETKEELGITVDLTFVGKQFDSQETQTRIFSVFTAVVYKDVEIKLDKNESDQYKWVEVSELDGYDMDNYVKQMIYLCVKHNF